MDGGNRNYAISNLKLNTSSANNVNTSCRYFKQVDGGAFPEPPDEAYGVMLMDYYYKPACARYSRVALKIRREEVELQMAQKQAGGGGKTSSSGKTAKSGGCCAPKKKEKAKKDKSGHRQPQSKVIKKKPTSGFHELTESEIVAMTNGDK